LSSPPDSSSNSLSSTQQPGYIGPHLRSDDNDDKPDVHEFNAIDWHQSAQDVWSQFHRIESENEMSDEMMTERQQEHFQRSPFQSAPQLPQGMRGVHSDFIHSTRGVPLNPDKLRPATYRLMRFTAIIAAILKTIVNSVLGKGFKIVGGDEEQREFLTWMYEQMDMNQVFTDVLTALPFGYSVTEKENIRITEGRWEGLWRVGNMFTFRPEGIEFEQNRAGRITRVTQDPLNTTGTRVVGSVSSASGGLIPLSLKKLLIFTVNSEFNNPWGESILKPVYTAWFDRRFLTAYEKRYLEIMGGGFFIGVAKKGKTRGFMNQIEMMKATSGIVHNVDQELKVIFPPKGDSPFRPTINSLDEDIARGLLTSLAIIGQTPQGNSRSSGEVNDNMFKLTVINRLHADLSKAFDLQVNRQIIDFNFGPKDEYSRIQFNKWSVLEQEQIANYFAKLAKVQIVGENDVPWMRQEMDVQDLRPGGIGKPLVKVDAITPAGQEPQASQSDGTAGDTEDDIDSTIRTGSAVGLSQNDRGTLTLDDLFAGVGG